MVVSIFDCNVISILFVETRATYLINSWKRIFSAWAIWKSHFRSRFQNQKSERPIQMPLHSDLLMDAGILRVEKHDDRLCFRNPGLLRLPIEMIYEGGNSKARNPRIQNMLRMIGYGENVGSGFPTILSAWKDAQWGEIKLKNKIEVDEVELVLPVPNNRNRDASDTINDRLNDSVMTTYSIISSNLGIQGNDIADISGKSAPTIDRHKAILIKEDLIEHRDSKKTREYYVK